METGSLSHRVAKGAAWIAGGGVVVRLIGLINTLILARLLTPNDFGVVAIGVTITQLLQNLSDVGVSYAVVHFRNAGRRELDTLFTFSVLRGVIVASLLIVVSFFAGNFYGDGRVRWVFLAMAAVAVVQSLWNPAFHEYQRNMDFSKEVYANALSKVASVAISVAVAVIFRTYWSIILGIAIGALVQLFVSYGMRPYRPRLSLAAFHDLIGYSGWLAGLSAVTAMNNKMDELIMGRIVGAQATGIYYVGHQVAALPGSEIALPIARALFPGLSSLNGDREKMRSAFLSGVEAMAFIALPAAIGAAFIADDLVMLLLGAQWSAAVPVLQFFAPVTGFFAIYGATQSFAMATGDTRPLFFRELLFFVIRTPAFIAVTIAYGLDGAIRGGAALALVHLALNIWLYRRISGGPAFEPVWRARRSILALSGLAVYFWGAKPLFGDHANLAFGVRLLVDISAGALAFLGVHFALWRAEGRPRGIESRLVEMLRRGSVSV